jgi:hypothetical protein
MSNSVIFKGYSTIDTTVKKTSWTDLDLIKRDLTNALYTRVGERVMNPTLGCVIWDLLFEPMTPENISIIQDNVTNIIASDGRVSITDFNLVQLDGAIQLQMNLYYAPANIVDAYTLNFEQKNSSSANS